MAAAVSSQSIGEDIRAPSKFRIPVSYRFVLILVVVGIVTHWQWFEPGFQSRWADNTGLPAAAFHQFSYSYLGWLSFTDLGGVNIQPYQLMFFQTWHFLASLGVNFATAEQITMLWPIAILSFLSPFLFIRRLFASDLGALAGALVYGLSTSLLVLEGFEIFLALGFSLLPLLLYSMDLFLERRSWYSLFLLVLIFNLLCYVEIRVAFLAFLLLVWYLIFALRAEGRIFPPSFLKIAVGGVLTVLLSAFWVIVEVQSSRTSITTAVSRNVFGNYFTNFEHAITLVSGSWVNGSLQVFVLGPIPFVMWAMPVLAVVGVLSKGSGRVLRRGAITLFGGGIAFVGVMLAKQVNPPIPSLYLWLYNHVPGFSLFRVGTDFFVIASLGYGILIAKFFAARSWSRADLKAMSFKTLYPFALVVIVATTVVPLVDGQVGALFVHRSRPSGLTQVTALIEGQKDFSRSLWLPALPNWSTFSLTHPAVSAVDLLNVGQPLQHNVVPFGPVSVGAAIVGALDSPRGREVLRKYSVQYLVLPPSDNPNTSPFYAYYGEPRNFYLSWLQSTPWLKKLAGFRGGYSVYRIIQPRPHGPIGGVRSTAEQRLNIVNPDLLVTKLPSLSGHSALIPVSMIYNPNWHAYVVPLQELGTMCQVSGERIDSCAAGSGVGILSNVWSTGLPTVSGVKGPLDQLEFRIASPAGLKNGAKSVAIVMVFGSALEEWILLYLAEIIFIILCSLVILNRLIPVIRISWTRWKRANPPATTVRKDLGNGE